MAVVHDDEPDVGEAIARALLAGELPELADRPLFDVTGSGTDNALWRIELNPHESLLLRLPRRYQPDEAIEREAAVLGDLADSPLAELVALPEVIHVGKPQPQFGHRWMVLGWIPGVDLTEASLLELEQLELAERLGGAVRVLGQLSIDAPRRGTGRRGGPIEPLVAAIHRWLDDPQWLAVDFVDVDACRRLADEALSATGEATVGFVHGDLLPGNVLRDGNELALIDWGGAGRADLAQDLAPAWSIFDKAGRNRFFEVVGADDASKVRARTFELEHAIGGIVYYEPKGHPLGDIMRRTYQRIMAAA